MRKNYVTLRLVSEHPNDQGRYTLEPPWDGLGSSFDSNDESELLRRLNEVWDHHANMTDTEVTARLDMTHRLSHGQIFDGLHHQSGGNIRDIRRQIELPKGTKFKDCQFWVYYLNHVEGDTESEQWLVLLPQVR